MKTTLVYVRDGKVAHRLSELASVNSFDAALCGTLPGREFWYGTGSQDEIDRAAALPRCIRCERRIRKD